MTNTTATTDHLADALLYLAESNQAGAIEKLRLVLRDVENGHLPNAKEAISLSGAA